MRSAIALHACSAWPPRLRPAPRPRARPPATASAARAARSASVERCGGLRQGVGRRAMRRLGRLQRIERLGPARGDLRRRRLQGGMFGLAPRRAAPPVRRPGGRRRRRAAPSRPAPPRWPRAARCGRHARAPASRVRLAPRHPPRGPPPARRARPRPRRATPRGRAAPPCASRACASALLGLLALGRQALDLGVDRGEPGGDLGRLRAQLLVRRARPFQPLFGSWPARRGPAARRPSAVRSRVSPAACALAPLRRLGGFARSGEVALQQRQPVALLQPDRGGGRRAGADRVAVPAPHRAVAGDQHLAGRQIRLQRVAGGIVIDQPDLRQRARSAGGPCTSAGQRRRAAGQRRAPDRTAAARANAGRRRGRRRRSVPRPTPRRARFPGRRAPSAHRPSAASARHPSPPAPPPAHAPRPPAWRAPRRRPPAARARRPAPARCVARACSAAARASRAAASAVSAAACSVAAASSAAGSTAWAPIRSRSSRRPAELFLQPAPPLLGLGELPRHGLRAGVGLRRRLGRAVGFRLGQPRPLRPPRPPLASAASARAAWPASASASAASSAASRASAASESRRSCSACARSWPSWLSRRVASASAARRALLLGGDLLLRDAVALQRGARVRLGGRAAAGSAAAASVAWAVRLGGGLGRRRHGHAGRMQRRLRLACALLRYAARWIDSSSASAWRIAPEMLR